MKTAISIDGELLREADETARSMGVSRSRLFTLAVDEYLKRQREERMLRQLNKVYGAPDRAEMRLVKRMKAKFGRTIEDTW